MLNNILEFLSRDTSELSTTGLIFICIGAFLFVALTVFFIKLCKDIVKQSGRKSFTFVKIIMIAVFPTILNIAAVFNHELPLNVILILTAIMAVIVAAWDFMTFGPIVGFMFSFLHIVGGLATGLLVAAFVLVGVFFIIMLILDPFTPPSPKVRDIKTGETFIILSQANDTLQIDRNGYTVLYPDYGGEYYDNHFNRYIKI